MDWISGVIVLASCAMMLGQLWGIVTTYRKIDLPGRVTGTLGAWVSLIMLGVIGLTRTRDVMSNPIVYFTIAALLIVFLLVRAGLGEEGGYHNGRLLPWKDIEYFMVIRETASLFSLRLHMRSGKDYVILFRPRYREAVIDRLLSNGVHDWDEFQFPGDAQQD